MYAVGSFKNGSVWELRYQQLSPTPGDWTLATALRGCNLSAYPHEAVPSRGKLYVKGFPSTGNDSTKLGCVVLDGTGGTMATRLWGAIGPTAAAALTPPALIGVTALSNANPCSVTTASPHGLTTGDYVTISGETAAAWLGINTTWQVTVTGASTFTIALNSTGFGASTGTVVIAWTTATNSVTVRIGWTYVYTWSLQSGQETNRSPLETNPDKAPSSSGPFTNRIPTMILQGPADTTAYPYVNVYRTTDGGGTFYFLKQITNTGGVIIFQDKYLESGVAGGTFNDPLPDAYLDTTRVSPSLTSNSPPPAVTPPQVTGTDTLKRSTRPVVSSGRIWYAIDEYVFYSALEELNEGVPEESFPSGVARPNFFRMPSTVVALLPTPSGLLCVTRKDCLRIQGTTRATFNPRPFLGNVGGAYGQRRSFTTVGENVAWLTQDFRIAVVHGDNYAAITDPLGNALKVAVDAGGDIELTFWAQGDKEWLIVASHRTDDTTETEWFIYDLAHARKQSDDFWFTPWHVRSTAMATGQSSATQTSNRLFVTLWNGTNAQLVAVDPTGATNSDPTPGATSTLVGYDWTFTTSLVSVPAGDHVNTLRKPNFSPTFACFQFDMTDNDGDTEPAIDVYLDDFYTDPLPMAAGQPPQGRLPSKGFTTLLYNNVSTQGWRNAEWVATRMTSSVDTAAYQINRWAFSWLPESGR